MTLKEECEILLETLLAASENLLKKNGEFYPIGAVLLEDSTAVFTAAHSDHDFPDSRSVINDLIISHRQMAQKNEIKASGIAWNGTVTSDEKLTDAIIVSLEHRDDYCVVVGLPYKKGLFGKLKFGALFAQSGNHDIF